MLGHVVLFVSGVYDPAWNMQSSEIGWCECDISDSVLISKYRLFTTQCINFIQKLRDLMPICGSIMFFGQILNFVCFLETDFSSMARQKMTYETP